MPSYRISPIDDLGTGFHVLAEGVAAARRLVALNVPEAAGAEDPATFDCRRDDSLPTVPGEIARHDGATVKVARY